MDRVFQEPDIWTGASLRANSHEMMLKPQQKRSSNQTSGISRAIYRGCMKVLIQNMSEGRKRPEEEKDILGEFSFRLFPGTICGSLRGFRR